MPNRKKATLISLKKAQSLIGKIIEMLEEEKYCIDIMQQNLAVIGLLRSTHQVLMENHLDTCFRKMMVTRTKRKNKDRKREMIEEILMVNRLYNR